MLVSGSYTPKECCAVKHRRKKKAAVPSRQAVKCRATFTIIPGGVREAGQSPLRASQVVAETVTKIESHIVCEPQNHLAQRPRGTTRSDRQ